jgi:hypothetical protein
MLVNSLDGSVVQNPVLKMLAGKKMVVFFALFMLYRTVSPMLDGPTQGFKVTLGENTLYEHESGLPTAE